ncbi:hypothetical protein [Bradyrhizobium sp. STM 3557]|uniref:hypothetical protein n=1 Tax=Bradyrhizobium sp. STM 3557 TaxID=578920 RepID=UPI003890190C
MINDLPAHMRIWSLSLAIYCTACTGAPACAVLTILSIMFEQVPTDIDASEIIEATIYHRTRVRDAHGLPGELLNAHVDRLIKGSIKTDTVKILLHQSSCPRVGMGHGIIVGDLQADPLLGLVLIPKGHAVR